MGMLVCAGGLLQCSFGTAPVPLSVLPQNKVMSVGPAANIMDHKPMVNVPTFGMCNSVANPATVRPPPVFFTPAPCVPATSSPWIVGAPTVLIANMPALNNSSKLICNWAGVIQIVFPGQVTAMVP